MGLDIQTITVSGHYWASWQQNSCCSTSGAAVMTMAQVEYVGMVAAELAKPVALWQEW